MPSATYSVRNRNPKTANHRQPKFFLITQQTPTLRPHSDTKISYPPMRTARPSLRLVVPNRGHLVSFSPRMTPLPHVRGRGQIQKGASVGHLGCFIADAGCLRRGLHRSVPVLHLTPRFGTFTCAVHYTASPQAANTCAACLA